MRVVGGLFQFRVTANITFIHPLHLSLRVEIVKIGKIAMHTGIWLEYVRMAVREATPN
jgi:hypothetical protein